MPTAPKGSGFSLFQTLPSNPECRATGDSPQLTKAICVRFLSRSFSVLSEPESDVLY